MFALDNGFAVCLEDYGRLKKYSRVPVTNELYQDVEQWLAEGNQFAELPVDFASPKNKEQLLYKAKSEYDEAIKQLVNDAPYSEIASWDKQEQEARALLVDSNAVTPFIDSLRLYRGLNETRLELATKIVQHADAYATEAARLLGEYQAKVKQINGV